MHEFIFLNSLSHIFMFILSTSTSWQKKPTKIQLTGMKEAMDPYPLIERKFFDDLNNLCRMDSKYVVEMGLLALGNQERSSLNPDLWILIWAKDFKDRIFQILIERHPDYGGKGAIAAIGPPDLLEFFSRMKQNALLPTLTLLNSPEKMKSVFVIVSRPESYKKKQKARQNFQALARFQEWIEMLKQTPNKEGKWFPHNAPTCPMCGGPLVGIADQYRIGFGYRICPKCGHSHREAIKKR
jgi:hypothetical protein